MATLVFFHAHPDDEAIATGGTMALAADAGHRVVLIMATGGELGEPVDGQAQRGAPLAAWRERELRRACDILGVHRLELLGFPDSGMAGDAANEDPGCFWQVDVERAAALVAEILTEEDAELVCVYDDNGSYGHPDHIQVHRVGVRAAEIAGVRRVVQSTINRTLVEEMAAEAPTRAEDDWTQAEEAEARPPEGEFGKPASDITHEVPVHSVIERKRAAMKAHASQISDDSWFLQLPPEVFARVFGSEWYIELGARRDAGAPFIDHLV